MGLDEMGLGRWVSVVGELAGELRDEGGTRRLERKKNFEEEERRKKKEEKLKRSHREREREKEREREEEIFV